jgi:hypothetical protein
MAKKPLPAIVARIIDDDGQLTNPDSAEAIEGQVDQGTSSDRYHRFTDSIPVGSQTAPLASSDDASLEDRMRRNFSHLKIFIRSGSLVTVA